MTIWISQQLKRKALESTEIKNLNGKTRTKTTGIKTNKINLIERDGSLIRTRINKLNLRKLQLESNLDNLRW